jgi:hypothetical protein
MKLGHLILSVFFGSLPLTVSALVPDRRNTTAIDSNAVNTTSALAPAAGDFTKTCRSIHGDGTDSHLIWACCQAGNQREWWETYIDMGNCLANQFGDMQWRKVGFFGDGCRDCVLFDSQNRYQCSCYNSVFDRWQFDSVILVRLRNDKSSTVRLILKRI